MLRTALVVNAILASLVSAQNPPQPKSTAEMLRQQWGSGNAGPDRAVKLTTFPLKVEEIDHIRPLGMMVGGHVTPSDHLYIVPKPTMENGKKFDVLAVADGEVTVIQWRPKGNLDPNAFDREVDLKVFVEHAPNCWSYVDHVTELDPAIRKGAGSELKPGQPTRTRIPVKGGQVLGTVTRAFDFALVDTSVTRKEFIRPEHFLLRDPWKPHTVDPFDYVAEPLRAKLLALNPRKVAPLGGKIGYDVDGKLIGNWYREGSGSYAGLNRRIDYWVGHLTVAYHFLDPSVVIISLGDFDGKARQFQVKGNGPDPAKVGKANGVVKYELIMPQINESTGKPYPDVRDRPMGILLVELIEDRKLRVECFPGKSGEDVKGFTKDARIYER